MNNKKLQQKILEKVIMETAKKVERDLDDKLDFYNSVQEDDEELNKIRAKRLAQLKKKAHLKKKWMLQGHGQITYINDFKEFFQAVKTNRRVVAFFFRSGSQFSDVMDSHLRKLCPIHIESLFIYVNAEKSQNLSKFFKIWMIPTVVLIKEEKTDYSIVGLDDLGGTGKFKTSALAKIMAEHGAISMNPGDDDEGSDDENEDEDKSYDN